MADEISFQWQNEFLLRTIYPMRATKLRDFLIYLFEIDLWAQYKAKTDAQIETEAQAYLEAQARQWDEAFDQYQTLRTYLIKSDVTGEYSQAFPEPEPEVLRKLNATHVDFSRYFPKLRSFNSEGYFISQYITLWEGIRKELLRLAAQKQRSIDVRRPDWEQRPRLEKEIQQILTSGIKMIDLEVDKYYAFQAAFTKIKKRRTDLEKWKKELTRQRLELAPLFSRAELDSRQLSDRLFVVAETLKQLKQPADIPTLEAYFRNPDCTTIYASQFSPPDAEALGRFNLAHKAVAPFLTPERSAAIKVNQLKIQFNVLEGLRKYVSSQVASIQRRLEIGGPTWPFREQKEKELLPLRDIKLAMYDQELRKLNSLISALVNTSRPPQELAAQIAQKEQEFADIQTKLETVDKEHLRLKTALDDFDAALNLPEKEQLARLTTRQKVTRQDIVRGKIEEYQKACSAKSESELLEEVVARFLAEPARYPLWLQYMVVHFSGMRYQSAHGSWANPIDLLLSLNLKDVEKEISRLDDAAVETLCHQKTILYSDAPLEIGLPGQPELITRPALASASAGSWVERVEMHLKGLSSDSPYRRRKALLELIIDEKSFEMDQLTIEQAEEHLKDMRSELPEWMWKEIVRLTSLRLTEVNEADWENPTALETAERNAYQASSFRALLNDWKQEFMTGWREEHDRSNRLIVTRAVCNEVAEHIQHLRGHTPGAGLTNKPLWYQRLERDPKLSTGKRPPYLIRATKAEDFKVGASILWLSFTHKMPSPWQIANPIRLKTGDGLLPDSLFRSGGGPRRYRKDSGGRVQRTGEITNEKGEKKSIDQWMRWLHEATVALVAETAEGMTVLTFETALPSEPRSRSAIGVFKHKLDYLYYRVDEEVFYGSFIGYAPPGELPLADLKEMLDWNKILRRPALSAAQIDAYWKKVDISL